MGKTKEIAAQEAQEQQFRESPLGKAITELEGHVGGHLVELFDTVGIKVEEEAKELLVSNFIGATHAAGTIQRLVWEQMDYEAKHKAELTAPKIEKAARKEAKKEETKKNRPRGKMTVKK
tara:strand:+ start:4287 stop:4646 length:360 start_codon:yes stop_codon:yes gene_type:complete